MGEAVARVEAGAARPASAVSIRRAEARDDDAIWAALEPMARAGETYTLDPGIGRAEALAYWRGGAGEETFVAEVDGVVVGSYGMRPNRGGNGAHVANASFVVHPDAGGRGVARAMGEHCLAHARARGFRAMQFNFVVSTNARAVRLWESLGFETLCRLPDAFHHPTLGFVDALVMVRRL